MAFEFFPQPGNRGGGRSADPGGAGRAQLPAAAPSSEGLQWRRRRLGRGPGMEPDKGCAQARRGCRKALPRGPAMPLLQRRGQQPGLPRHVGTGGAGRGERKRKGKGGGTCPPLPCCCRTSLRPPALPPAGAAAALPQPAGRAQDQEAAPGPARRGGECAPPIRASVSLRAAGTPPHPRVRAAASPRRGWRSRARRGIGGRRRRAGGPPWGLAALRHSGPGMLRRPCSRPPLRASGRPRNPARDNGEAPAPADTSFQPGASGRGWGLSLPAPGGPRAIRGPSASV